MIRDGWGIEGAVGEGCHRENYRYVPVAWAAIMTAHAAAESAAGPVDRPRCCSYI